MEVVLAYARALAANVADVLARSGEGARVAVAGGVRRAEESVDELVVVVDRAPAEVAQALGSVAVDIARGERGAVLANLPLEIGPLPLRVRCASPRGFVAALLQETGSEPHLEALEARAVERETTLADVCSAARAERDVYAALDLPFVAPELRDGGRLDEGEALVDSVRGVLHVHTTWSDGALPVVDMARAALAAGFTYVGISDHSHAASYARGLDPERLGRQRDAVARAREEAPGITILHGIEVDVMPDGTLDLPDPVLSRLDFVVASLHTDLGLDRAAQTRRMVRALSHPMVDVLGHPTGRLIGARPPSEFDLDEVARAAAKSGACLEINTSAQRLDLSADMARRAASFGASFCIDPDAHEARAFETVHDGVLLARRARLPRDRVLNTLDVGDFRRALAARRANRAHKPS